MARGLQRNLLQMLTWRSSLTVMIIGCRRLGNQSLDTLLSAGSPGRSRRYRLMQELRDTLQRFKGSFEGVEGLLDRDLGAL